MEVFTLSEEEWGRLAELSAEAQRTPVIYTPAPGQRPEEVRSWADHARDRVMGFWRELGAKHGFKWDSAVPHDEAARQIRAERAAGEPRRVENGH